jgi:hypothetical protein
VARAEIGACKECRKSDRKDGKVGYGRWGKEFGMNDGKIGMDAEGQSKR